MSTNKRHGNKWTINEVLRLQREYELLEMNVQEIATRHERSTSAILSKLLSEEFITTFESARGYDTQEQTTQSLIDRIWNLETNVTQIGGMVNAILSTYNNNNNTINSSHSSQFVG
jgi:hypothetical protein